MASLVAIRYSCGPPARGREHAGGVHRRALRDPEDLHRRHLPRQRLERHRSRSAGEEVHGRRRPGSRRGHQRDGARPAGRARLRERVPARRVPAQRLAGLRARRHPQRPRHLARRSSWTWTSTTTRSSGGCRGGAPARSAGTSGTSSTTRRRPTGICDSCGGELYQRDDDQPDTVRHRLEVYAEQTAPLIGFYRRRKQLVEIDALGTVEDVTERAIAALDPVRRRLTAAVYRLPERIELSAPSRSRPCAGPAWWSPGRCAR